MKSLAKILMGLLLLMASFLPFSCEKFFDPDQDMIIKENEFYKDWNEYRSAELGLYALQQKLVEQMIILGELRGDLMEVTQNADQDLVDIYNFNISPNNKYTQPNNFYILIGAANSLARKLETSHPDVLDPEKDLTEYDRLYGEVLCMRAWAYFNAVKIYNKIPYIWPSLTTDEEIFGYINSPQMFYDVEEVIYNKNGYNTDTIMRDTIILEKMYLDMRMVIDTFTNQLQKRIKSVGVIHNLENGDLTWNVTVWNNDAYHALMGEMHLFNSNLSAAYSFFRPIMNNYKSETSNIYFGLDSKFAFSKWSTIFEGIDPYEHILILEFNRKYQQQHQLQSLFSSLAPNLYMLKPTRLAVENWETIWSGTDIEKNNTNPNQTYMKEPGTPGDFYRGNRISYAYRRGFELLSNDEVRLMLHYKSIGNTHDVENLMNEVDTVIYKYSIKKDIFDHDANFIIYRAANIHLYCAEIFSYWLFDKSGNGILSTDVNKSLAILNNGSYREPPNANQLGVRGRVGFGEGDDAVYVENFIYKHDPYTNEVIGFIDLSNNLAAKQEYLEDQIIKERALELAYEGNRFYDLVRVAKRRNDPSYLAKKVAAKFSGEKASQIEAYLMNEENWYIPID